jgi:formate dehydrogenase iron-sulfur subunit
MTITVYIPGDAAAVALGADEVAATLRARAGDAVRIVRNGSRGLLWLEPLVEVVTAQGRIAYGPVAVDDVADLLDSGLLHGGAHRLRHGDIEQHPYLTRQTRLVFARCGVTDPLSMDDYRSHGGVRGLDAARGLAPMAILDLVEKSGLRGRGGAGFPAGTKWRTVADVQAAEKFIVCNADEGDSGTFADRMIMEGDPLLLVEGMVIAARAVGATRGYVYVRSEYPHAIAALGRAVDVARGHGWFEGVFDIEVREGAGAYICGEETALLESIEGRRGLVRAKPPLPAHRGLFDQPTVINNVLTLCSVPWILAAGPEAYRALGQGRSLGTQPFQLAGNVRFGGLVELPFGCTLDELVNDFGGGTASGRPVKAVQMGGPLGAYIPAAQFGVACDYEALAAAGAMLGHGGVVVFDDAADMAQQARFAMDFCAIESCGKCTPCRIGAVRGRETIDDLIAGRDVAKNLVVLEDLCELMTDGSLCAMGGLTPLPVRSIVKHFGPEIGWTRTPELVR